MSEELTETTPTNEADNTTAAEESMGLSVTSNAAEKIAEIRDAEAIEPHYALRVKVLGGGCAGFQYDLFFDDPADDDNKFDSGGVSLVCDSMSFMYLMGTEIDYVDGLQGAGFKFGNPNTTGSCGCGSSFSV